MTTETTHDATTTPDSASATPPAETTATAAGTLSQPAETPASTEAAQPDAATATEPAKPAGAPEAYSFTAPEGQVFDDSIIGAYSAVAKELNLPQEAAQKMLETMAPAIAARQAEQFEATKTQWAEDARADKEFGGDKLQENLGLALKARDAFATPELRTLLESTGLGNHPEVIRFFFRAGKAISEDRFIAGRNTSTPPNDARSLYSASNMNP